MRRDFLFTVMAAIGAIAGMAQERLSMLATPKTRRPSRTAQIREHAVRHGTGWWAPEQRHGLRERTRRLRQMANGTHGLGPEGFR